MSQNPLWEKVTAFATETSDIQLCQLFYQELPARYSWNEQIVREIECVVKRRSIVVSSRKGVPSIAGDIEMTNTHDELVLEMRRKANAGEYDRPDAIKNHEEQARADDFDAKAKLVALRKIRAQSHTSQV